MRGGVEEHQVQPGEQVAPPREECLLGLILDAARHRLDQSRDCEAEAKRYGVTDRKLQYWVIPPEEDVEFVAYREEVLETYERSYDTQHPVICRDEQPVQLIQETREALPATKQHPQRVD